MALQYVGGTSGTGTGASYNISLSGTLTGGIASSPAEGDIVIVASGFGNTASSAPTCSGDQTGAYTGLHTAIHSNDTWDTEFRAFYALMGATPDTTLTIGRVSNAAYGGATVVHVWRGVDQSTPIDVTTVTASAGNASRPDAGAITPVTSGAVILACGAGMQTTAGSAFTIPSGMTNGVSVFNNGSTSDIGTFISSDVWTSGAYNPAAVTGGTTSNSGSWAAATIALRPGAVPPIEQSVTGSLTPSGGLGKVILKAVTGSVSPVGGISRDISKILTGSTTATGLATKATTLGTPLGGSITPSAALDMTLLFAAAVGGSITMAGSMVRAISKSVSGAITAAGSISRWTSRTLSGSLTAAGQITRLVSRALVGVLTPQGGSNLSVSTRRTLDGSINPAGEASGTPLVPAVPSEDAVQPFTFLRRYIGRR